MMQIIAILRDSMRELRSSSLFWICLVISALVAVLLFGLIGFDEDGWKLLWFDTNNSGILYEGSDASRSLLAWLFGGAFVWWWLSWGAIVLALISTSSVIPNLIAEGAIDVTLAKPLGRIKLFITKVVGAALFMIAQVTLAVSIAYLLMGLRFDMWFHKAWLAIPLLTLQFLYLFIPMAYVGLRTRSALASVIIVMIFWGVVSLVQFVNNQVDENVAAARTSIQLAEQRQAEIRDQAEQEDRELTSFEQSRLDRIEEHQIAPNRSVLDVVEPWQPRIHVITLFVPKTADIQRIIATFVEAPTFNELVFILQGGDPEMLAQMLDGDREMAEDVQQAGLAGSAASRQVNRWISLGTSIAFVALFLALCLWNFCRRDF